MGEAHYLKGYEALMDECAPNPKVLLADRGYDADAVRADVGKARRIQIEMDRASYALRNRIERCFKRLKNARRVAAR
jgi:transposase